MEIDVRELCNALGVEYDAAKSSEFYLMLVKQYRIRYEAAQHRVQADGAEAAANGLVYKVEWVDAETIRLTPRR